MRTQAWASWAVAVTAAGLVLAPAAPSQAQSIYGTLVGTVRDTSGAVIPGAAITVVRSETGEARSFTTDHQGTYTATNLPPGQYSVEAAVTGFRAARRAVVVQVGMTPRLDLVLEVGTATDVVDVVGEPPLLNTATSSLGHVVDQKALVTLPVPSGGGGRNFFTLALIAPGVTAQYEGYGLNNMRINGGRPKADDYLLDGTSVQQIVFGGPAITPPLDSIQEFKLDSNSYPAEYGRISGGIMNAVTRSGGNRLRGSVWEFYRSHDLDARNFFLPRDKEKDRLRQHEYGGTLGGPLVHNKLFFFVDYQGFRHQSDRVFTNVQVPTAAMKSGDFGAFLGAQLGVDPCGRPVLGGAIYDPATQRVALPGDATCPGGSGGALVRDPFPGNRVPAPRFSRVASSLLGLWPDPQSGSNFSRIGANRNDVDQFDARIDFNASSSDRFFGVFHYSDSRNRPAAPLTDERAAGTQSVEDNPKSGTFGWDHTFGPGTINTFRFGFMLRNPARVPGGYGTVGPADYGLASFPACNLPGSGGKCGTPVVNIPGVQRLSDGSMLFEPAKIYQVAESVTHIAGNHNLKAGADLRHFRIDNIQPNAVNGDFSFTSAATALPGFAGQTGAAFASFLLGEVGTGSGQFQEDFFKTQTSSISLYVQDDWRVRPNLTLNLGLRYQLDLAWKARVPGTAGNFNRDTLKYELLGVDGVPETNFENDYDNFGPRLGFAWNPTPSLVLRGAYGMMFPGNTTRGRGGDLDPSALLLVNTRLDNTRLDGLPPVNSRVADPEGFLKGVGPYTASANRRQEQQYMQQWNFTVEKQVFGDMLLAASYAGSKGSRLLNNFFYNVFQLSADQVRAAGCTTANVFDCAGYYLDGPLGPPGNGGFLNIYPLFEQDASSIYHSLQAKAEKRFSGGISFVASYTMSKLVDDASADWSAFGGLDNPGQDYLNRRTDDRSVSAGDIRHRLVVSSIVELPFGPGKRHLNTGLASRLLGGWVLSSIFTAHSGFPFGVYDDCFGFCNYARSSATRPDKTGNPAVSGGERSLDRWVNKGAYRSNYFDPQRPFGTAPRYDDEVRGPGVVRLDAALIKTNRLDFLRKDALLELRLELFNALNTPHFAMPVASFGAGNFGAVTGTASPNRQAQLGVRLIF